MAVWWLTYLASSYGIYYLFFGVFNRDFLPTSLKEQRVYLIYVQPDEKLQLNLRFPIIFGPYYQHHTYRLVPSFTLYRHYINKHPKLSRVSMRAAPVWWTDKMAKCRGLVAACFRLSVHRPLGSQYCRISPAQRQIPKKCWPSSL